MHLILQLVEAARLISKNIQVPTLNSLFKKAVHLMVLTVLFFQFLRIALTSLFSGYVLTTDVCIKNHRTYVVLKCTAALFLEKLPEYLLESLAVVGGRHAFFLSVSLE